MLFILFTFIERVKNKVRYLFAEIHAYWIFFNTFICLFVGMPQSKQTWSISVESKAKVVGWIWAQLKGAAQSRVCWWSEFAAYVSQLESTG